MIKHLNQEPLAKRILCLLIMIFAYVFFLPIIFIFGFFYNYKKYSGLKNLVSGSISDYWLSKDDKVDFALLVNSIKTAEQVIEKANRKEKNCKINNSQSTNNKVLKIIIRSYKKSLSQSKSKYNMLINLPRKRCRNFQNSYAKIYAYAISFVVWVLLLIYLSTDFLKNTLTDIYKVVLFPIYFTLLTMNDIVNNDVGLFFYFWLKLFSAGIVVYLISFMFFKRKINKISPLPPKVNKDNHDKY